MIPRRPAILYGSAVATALIWSVLFLSVGLGRPDRIIGVAALAIVATALAASHVDHVRRPRVLTPAALLFLTLVLGLAVGVADWLLTAPGDFTYASESVIFGVLYATVAFAVASAPFAGLVIPAGTKASWPLILGTLSATASIGYAMLALSDLDYPGTAEAIGAIAVALGVASASWIWTAWARRALALAGANLSPNTTGELRLRKASLRTHAKLSIAFGCGILALAILATWQGFTSPDCPDSLSDQECNALAEQAATISGPAMGIGTSYVILGLGAFKLEPEHWAGGSSLPSSLSRWIPTSRKFAEQIQSSGEERR